MSELVVTTPMTERDFATVFGKLALQLQRTADADLATIKSYFEALADLPLAAIQSAAVVYAREPGRKWMPTTGEWREQVHVVQRQALRRVVPPAREAEWHFDCDRCFDTGWALWTCDGGGAQWPEDIEPNTRGKTPWSFKPQARDTAIPRPPTCQRRQPHLPHDYVEPCVCRPTNRTWQRKYGCGA